MKELHFYVLFVAIAAVQTGLIMGGILDPLTSYSARNILFNVFVAAVVIYMGGAFSESGIKKVAMKGAIVAFVSVTVITCASLIGYTLRKPVLGISIPSAASMIVPLMLILLSTLVLYAILAVVGALIVQRFKATQMKRKETEVAKK
jgi:hypothetical protein